MGSLLNADEFFNNYLKGKVFPDNEYINKPEVQQAIKKAWGLVLDHLEANIAIAVPSGVYNSTPAMTTASHTGFILGFPRGTRLGGTGSILATKHVNTIAVPAGYDPNLVNQTIQNVSIRFNELFNYIINNSEVIVKHVQTSGVVVQGTSSVPASFVSTVDMIGTII